MKYNLVEYQTMGSQNQGWEIYCFPPKQQIEIEVASNWLIFKALKDAGFFPKGTRADSISFNNEGERIRIHRMKDYKPLGELVAI